MNTTTDTSQFSGANRGTNKLDRRETRRGRKKRSKRGRYPASSATPPATSTAAIQRRRSTFSCRKIFAANAFPMKVNDAAAGATRLTSPHDKENSSPKNAAAIPATPKKNVGVERIRPTTFHNP